MKKYLKIFILITIILILSNVIYLKTTKISYKDNKGHISPLYCKLFKKTSIDKAVIFIPGIKGSRLEDNQKQSWLTTAQLLQNTEPFIYKQPLHAIGILDRIVIIPYIYEYRAYYLISSQFSCNNSTYLFSYDWRSKPEENAEKLEEFIIKVTRETNQKPIIIAHSMGGLITRYIEEKNPAIIEKIAYISTPFKPGISFFNDITKGSETGLNKTINNAEAVRSYYSSFTLLPHKSQLLYEKNSLLSEDFWKNTLFKNLKISESEQVQILDKIQKANQFHEFIDKPRSEVKNNLYINSTCKNTEYSVEQQKEFHVPGDGRVTAEASIPNDFDQNIEKIFTHCSAHDQQLNDPIIYDKLVEFINK
jgi:hypothetical protein